MAPTTIVTNKKKNQKKQVITPEQREVFAREFSLLTELIGENAVEYVFEMLTEDPSNDTREIVRGILIEAVLSQGVIDEAGACAFISDILVLFNVFVNTINITSDPIVLPPTNTQIQSTLNTNTNTNTKIRQTTTNKTHTHPKD